MNYSMVTCTAMSRPPDSPCRCILAAAVTHAEQGMHRNIDFA